MMEIVGYILAILVGISLGLIGGGGSILTVPIISFLFGVSATLATTYSLFIVGMAAFAGSFTYFKQNNVDLKTTFLFGIPTIVGIYLSRGILVPYLPDVIFSSASFSLTKDLLIMLLFAVLMLAASLKMILSKMPSADNSSSSPAFLTIIITGLFVGLITGFVGAGGGFIIVPALITFFKLPIKKAIGTSLGIITLNSFFGFLVAIEHQPINWTFLLTFSGLAILGIVIGSWLSTFIDGKKLKPAFGWFVLVMGVFILIKSAGSL